MWNAVVERMVSRREHCRGHHREEEIVEALRQLPNSLPFMAAPAPGGLRSAQDLLSREYLASA